MSQEINSTNHFLGHPKGLFYLFFAELWERFSFYGMRALLILYMTQHLLYDDKMSIGIYAAYGSLVYATPLIGGYLADKILGYQKAIFLGGILMALGHFILAIDHPIAFYLALALLIIGNGFFKPNISSLVGALYENENEKRDAGFTIFYMGINIGGWIAPLLCGYIGFKYGWHYGFALAGFGMLLGLIVFYSGVKKGVFGNRGTISDKKWFNQKLYGIKKGHLITIGALLSTPFIALILKYNEFESYLVWLVSFGILFILFKIYKNSNKDQRNKLIVVVYFTLLACVFWAIFEQAGSSLTLFAKRNVDLKFLNASQTNSLNSLYIILLALPFTWLWTYLNKKRKNPNSALKIGVGLVFVGIGFLLFGYSGNFANEQAKVPMLFLALGIFIYTIGEMFLSPIGLSKVTELSPKKYVSFLMGVWFLSSFYGHFFAGIIAKFTTISDNKGNIFTTGALKEFTKFITGLDIQTIEHLGTNFKQLFSYVSVFTGIGLFSLLIGIIAILISPKIKKLMGDVN